LGNGQGAAAQSAVGAHELIGGFVVTEFRRLRPYAPRVEVLPLGSLRSMLLNAATAGSRERNAGAAGLPAI
jgi:hypothetical protein